MFRFSPDLPYGGLLPAIGLFIFLLFGLGGIDLPTNLLHHALIVLPGGFGIFRLQPLDFGLGHWILLLRGLLPALFDYFPLRAASSFARSRMNAASNLPAFQSWRYCWYISQ